MRLTDLLTSKRTRTVSTVWLLAEAALAFARDDRQLAGLLALAAVLSYRFTTLGYLAQVGVRLYQWQR